MLNKFFKLYQIDFLNFNSPDIYVGAKNNLIQQRAVSDCFSLDPNLKVRANNIPIYRVYKILLITAIATIFFAKNIFADGPVYSIKVKIKGLKDTVCYIGYHYGDKKYIKDTLKVDAEGNCVYEGNKELEGGIYLVIMPNKTYFEILINTKEQKFSLETDTADFVENMKVVGSHENKIFNEYQRFMVKQYKSLPSLNERLEKNKENADSTKIIKEQITKINEEVTEYRLQITDKYPESFLAKIIKTMKEPEVPEPPKDKDGKILDSLFSYKYYKQHFFDDIDFSDGRLMRTPILHEKVMQYMDKLTPIHPDSIIVSADLILEKAKANKDIFRYFLVTLTHKYETSKYMGMDAVFVHLAERYYLTGQAEWADSALIAKIEERVNKLRPTLLGVKATNILLWDTLGKLHSLYELKAKYTIIFFYDPDCGHCEKEIPKMVELYHKVKPYDVEVFGVCTVTDVQKWKDYIKKEKMDWLNVADPYYRSKFRDYYDIYSTPVIYLLDEKKEILAKRIDTEQLENILNKKLGIKEENK